MKNKIVTVTLNPCLDRLVAIPSFTHGGMNRVSSVRTDPAGKGLNVSAALKSIGVESICTGFNYSDNGAVIENYLRDADIPFDFVNVEGAVRTNIKLVEQDTLIMTEINQSGAYVPPAQVEELVGKAAALEGELLILSGSRPQGVGEDIYTQLLANWKGRAFLDTEGAALKSAIFSGRPPYLIKPNLFELETAFGVKLPDKGSIADFCRKTICDKGVKMVCVSMGGDGALLITKEYTYFAPALKIPVRGLAGAGDSMVAGLAAGLINAAPPEEMLRMGLAAASASVIREGTQMCTREGYEEMLKLVKICSP